MVPFVLTCPFVFTQNYADTVLVSPREISAPSVYEHRGHQHVFQHTYGLHAIILSRSPFLAHLMSTAPLTGGQRVIYVPLEHEPEVTQEVSPRVFFQPPASF
jgi:hypothetical protein